MASNADLAAQFARQAEEAAAHRRVLLVAATALTTTTSVRAARRALADPELHISTAVRTAALTLLDQITQDVPVASRGDGAAQEERSR